MFFISHKIAALFIFNTFVSLPEMNDVYPYLHSSCPLFGGYFCNLIQTFVQAKDNLNAVLNYLDSK